MVIVFFFFYVAPYIKIYDSLGNQLASTSTPVNIFGGDLYTVSSNISNWTNRSTMRLESCQNNS